jgi:predicted DNA-binding protein
MPFSLRLDPDTEARIRRLTSETGKSRAAIVREAVAQYAAAQDPQPAPAASAYDRVKPFVGIVRSDRPATSESTHDSYRASLRRKYGRAQRSR